MKQQVIFYATGNSGKFAIAQQFLERELPGITIKQLVIDSPEIQTYDQALIAEQKAAYGAAHIKAPVLADDGGLYLDAYDNFPGFMTKYVYNSLGVDGILKLCAENNKAHFKIFFSYMDGAKTASFIGQKSGRLVPPPAPIPQNCPVPFLFFFIPDGFTAPYTSLPVEEHTPDNHFRLNGLKKFAQWYKINYEY